MSELPKKLEQILGDKIYKRDNKVKVKQALTRLDVNTSYSFNKFYEEYAGPFWDTFVPFELLDIVEEKNNIENYTYICRSEHSFPKHYLVLSEMSVNTVLVLDTLTDKVYKVDFEGGEELLLKGELREEWSTFYEFLLEYFNC
ncbi:1,3-beta-glucan synthase regulator [Solibacillus sp. R5-41]|uniref:1,3-beta-glucan synthase regulator n=1 Tax=Solibacillus sp. R5-41 TaxID=2048654 RepID=UPI000C1288A7|nr:1,3-beta-glucan synthase regulator [Solibacillus sp. R5-41]ATP40852.1 1,3-beta-glucan synthase regulator [Solibacillus sp. R5-41]